MRELAIGSPLVSADETETLGLDTEFLTRHIAIIGTTGSGNTLMFSELIRLEGIEVLSKTREELSTVRVKRKGQVTIPTELRSKLGIEEGSLLVAKEEAEGMLLQKLPSPKPGRPIGKREYSRLIQSLDKMRRRWPVQLILGSLSLDSVTLRDSFPALM